MKILTKKKMLRECGLVLVGAVCGVAWGWHGAGALIGLSVLVPLAWAHAQNRLFAAAVMFAYYLGVSRGLPEGTGIFFAQSAPVWFGWALWAGVAALNASVWGVLWSHSPRRVAIGIPAAILITALPPIGLIGWANPLTAAGTLFPGLGFIGIALLLAVWVAVVLGRRAIVLGLTAACLLSNAIAPSMVVRAPSWIGMDTHYGRLGSGSTDFMAAFSRIQSVQDLAERLRPGQVAVLPETIMGRFTEATESLLADTNRLLAAKGSAIIAGAELFGESGTGRLNNALVVLDGQGTKPMIQRVPVPIGMWRPWDSMTFDAYPFGRGISKVAGKRVAYAVCYEQLLVYPLLVSLAHSPDVMIGAANDWWARTTSIPEIQGQALDAWGRLFNVPVIRATNI
ncbi:carbon-nitrogen hydrolase family protein [Burkholderia vietnamiensis]|uniref:nitrilase-related carbon-nitrogen hydrolase n=1 Tax=Burkholderia vietnamiensis TaxID=60552 RepID=UPI0015938E36|nr:nitrilase-related carbon-nitrogen hydrolase [Burkholderia vietnamiensis]MCA8270698.1 hypothetical protein [Burkholderia vietnamiensis]